MAKILRKSEENQMAQFPKLSVSVGQNSILRRYYTQNIKDGIQIRVYTPELESVTCFSQFISVKVKKVLRTCQAQFGERVRKLQLGQNDGFLRKSMYTTLTSLQFFQSNLFLAITITSSVIACMPLGFSNLSMNFNTHFSRKGFIVLFCNL